MYWDVVHVEPLADYRIFVKIKDGRSGVFDMKPYLDCEAYRELNDSCYFNQVGIFLDAVTWPHGQDVAPENIVDEMIPMEQPPAMQPDEYKEVRLDQDVATWISQHTGGVSYQSFVNSTLREALHLKPVQQSHHQTH